MSDRQPVLRSLALRPVKALARPVADRVEDARDRRNGVVMPPRALRAQVSGDFRAVGREFLPHLIELGGLRPDARVLEIGGRAGRMAIPLTRYIAPEAQYESVDDWHEATDWCQRNVSPSAPNFRFVHLAMVPGGDGDARGGRAPEPLPYDDGSFDFVTLASIIYLPPSAFDYYLREAVRVLAPGGTYFGTWYLRAQGACTSEPPLACAEDDARQRLDALGLSVEAVHRGSWDGHLPSLSYQDVVIGRRRTSTPPAEPCRPPRAGS